VEARIFAMNVAGDDEILLHMDTDNAELLVSDDIQCILQLLGRTVPVHMEDLRCCRLAGLVSLHDIVVAKWDLISLQNQAPIRPTVTLMLHLFAIWIEEWMNECGDINFHWRKCLVQPIAEFTSYEIFVRIYIHYVKANYCGIRLPDSRSLEHMYGINFRLMTLSREELVEIGLLGEV
jgi:hypothetical protein